MAEKSRGNIAAALIEIMAEFRRAQGLSLEELADKAGIHRTTLGLLERKERSPSIDSALRLAAALDVELSVLLARAEAAAAGAVAKTQRAVSRRLVREEHFHEEEVLKASTGFGHECLQKAIEACYQTLDTIDFGLVSRDYPPFAHLVELANFSATVGNLLGAGLAAHSSGLYERNKPHHYPDLLCVHPNKRHLELKMALGTNRPKGHLSKAGTYLTFRYVLADKEGKFQRGSAQRGDTAFVWEAKVGNINVEDFDVSNTAGDSGKTAVIKTKVFEAMAVVYYEPTLLPYAKPRKGYPGA